MSNRLADKNLTIARELLAVVKIEKAGTLQQQGLLNSALAHVYISLLHYLDELQDAYPYYAKNPAEKNDHSLEIPSFTKKLSLMHESVSEAQELKQLLERSDSWLLLLINSIRSLYNEEDEKAANEKLISVSDVSESAPQKIDTLQGAQWLLDECYECIQRQREHAIEC